MQKTISQTKWLEIQAEEIEKEKHTIRDSCLLYEPFEILMEQEIEEVIER